MYSKMARKLTRLKQNKSRSQPFWISAEIQQKTLFVRNSANSGRLGNKLFQLAGVFGVAKQNNRTPILLEAAWNIVNKYFDARIFKDYLDNNISNFLNIFEQECHTRNNETINLPPRNVTIGHYLLSRQYFDNAEEELRSELVFKEFVLGSPRKFLSQSFSPPINGTTFARIVIQVRRGDLLLEQRSTSGFVELSSDYFSRSMTYFRQCYDRVQFVVVSDDMAWCQQNVVGPDVIYFSGVSSGEDLALSSLCHHAITTYGTFSMWAAWFADGITIRPRNLSPINSILDKVYKLEVESFPADTVQI